MDIMTALVLAFVLGIGMASIGSRSMLPLFDEFNAIIEKVISYIIIPLLPIPHFRDFPEHDIRWTSGKSTCPCLQLYSF